MYVFVSASDGACSYCRVGFCHRDGMEVAIVYQRTCYVPEHFESEKVSRHFYKYNVVSFCEKQQNNFLVNSSKELIIIIITLMCVAP